MMEDDSSVDEILAALDGVGGSEIVTGIIGEGGTYEGGLTVLDIANIHEYGSKNSPERPFIRGVFEHRWMDVIKHTEQTLQDIVILSLGADTGLDILGQQFADWTQEYLRDLSTPPNSPVTIKMKGSSSPLIDTGRLIGSIDYEVS